MNLQKIGGVYALDMLYFAHEVLTQRREAVPLQEFDAAATAIQVATARACLNRIVANMARINQDAQIMFATTTNIAARLERAQRADMEPEAVQPARAKRLASTIKQGETSC